jgi:hypothetical protein
VPQAADLIERAFETMLDRTFQLGWDRNSGIRNSGRNSFQEWAIPDPSQEFQVQELPRGVPWLEY